MFGPQPLMFSDTSTQVTFSLTESARTFNTSTIQLIKIHIKSILLLNGQKQIKEIKSCQEYPYQLVVQNVKEKRGLLAFSTHPGNFVLLL